MEEFAREGSLMAGMRAIFPPAYKEEYTRLFREAGAGVVISTEAVALLQRWQRNLAIGGGVLVGGLAGGLIAASEIGGVVAAEGAAAAVAAETAASALAAEGVVAEAAATAGGVAGGSTAVLGFAASSFVAVAVGYFTFRGLKWLLPEVQKQQYTVLMGVPEEDLDMLEMGRQMSMVESSVGPACGICMDRPQDAAAVPCGHTACKSCIDQLLQRHGGVGETPCPHCRKPIHSVQRLYF